MTLGQILSEALIRAGQEADEREAARRVYLTGCDLARKLAHHWGLTEASVFEEMKYMPDDMLSLLQSPFGHTTIAEYIRSDLGITAPVYVPTIH